METRSVRELAYALQLPGGRTAFRAFTRLRLAYQDVLSLAEEREKRSQPDESEDVDADPEVVALAAGVRKRLDRRAFALDRVTGDALARGLRAATDEELAAAELEPEVLPEARRQELARAWRERESDGVSGSRFRFVLGRRFDLSSDVVAHAMGELPDSDADEDVLDVVYNEEREERPEPDWKARAKLEAFLLERRGLMADAFLLCRTRDGVRSGARGHTGELGRCHFCRALVLVLEERRAFLRPGAKLACVGCLGAIPESATILGPRPFSVEAITSRARDRADEDVVGLQVAVKEGDVAKTEAKSAETVYECPCGARVTGRAVGTHKRHHGQKAPPPVDPESTFVVQKHARDGTLPFVAPEILMTAGSGSIEKPAEFFTIESAPSPAAATPPAEHDPELLAIVSIKHALEGLDPAARERVTRYVVSRFGPAA